MNNIVAYMLHDNREITGFVSSSSMGCDRIASGSDIGFLVEQLIQDPGLLSAVFDQSLMLSGIRIIPDTFGYEAVFDDIWNDTGEIYTCGEKNKHVFRVDGLTVIKSLVKDREKGCEHCECNKMVYLSAFFGGMGKAQNMQNLFGSMDVRLPENHYVTQQIRPSIYPSCGRYLVDFSGREKSNNYIGVKSSSTNPAQGMLKDQALTRD